MSIFWIGWFFCGFLAYGVTKNFDLQDAMSKYGPKYSNDEEFICWAMFLLGYLGLLHILIFRTPFEIFEDKKIGLRYRMPRQFVHGYISDGFPLQITDNRSK